ncbi:hypothetical protein D9M70_488530 [compost metagenome]
MDIGRLRKVQGGTKSRCIDHGSRFGTFNLLDEFPDPELFALLPVLGQLALLRSTGRDTNTAFVSPPDVHVRLSRKFANGVLSFATQLSNFQCRFKPYGLHVAVQGCPVAMHHPAIATTGAIADTRSFDQSNRKMRSLLA